MDVKIYANYGVLAHEKQVVFTTAPAMHAVVSEEIEVSIPDDIFKYVAESGQIVLELDYQKYLLGEVLEERNDKPVISWFDGRYHKCIEL